MQFLTVNTMTEPRFFWIDGTTLRSAAAAPTALHPIETWRGKMLPPLISAWHRSFKTWADLGLSPGLATPGRIWAGQDGALAFRFARNEQPRPISHVGQARELATWLVLLDKWMETSVVVACARAVWSSTELGGALSFTTPRLSAAHPGGHASGQLGTRGAGAGCRGRRRPARRCTRRGTGTGRQALDRR